MIVLGVLLAVSGFVPALWSIVTVGLGRGIALLVAMSVLIRALCD
ncbi:hypothetical protein [Nonomuraea sp. NPDC049028]